MRRTLATFAAAALLGFVLHLAFFSLAAHAQESWAWQRAAQAATAWIPGARPVSLTDRREQGGYQWIRANLRYVNRQCDADLRGWIWVYRNLRTGRSNYRHNAFGQPAVRDVSGQAGTCFGGGGHLMSRRDDDAPSYLRVAEDAEEACSTQTGPLVRLQSDITHLRGCVGASVELTAHVATARGALSHRLFLVRYRVKSAWCAPDGGLQYTTRTKMQSVAMKARWLRDPYMFVSPVADEPIPARLLCSSDDEQRAAPKATCRVTGWPPRVVCTGEPR